MYGKNFCPAANMAFNSVVRHPLHVASIAAIGSVCMMLCRLLVASCTTASTLLYLVHVCFFFIAYSLMYLIFVRLKIKPRRKHGFAVWLFL